MQLRACLGVGAAAGGATTAAATAQASSQASGLHDGLQASDAPGRRDLQVRSAVEYVQLLAGGPRYEDAVPFDF
jgi:hypothetical protein